MRLLLLLLASLLIACPPTNDGDDDDSTSEADDDDSGDDDDATGDDDDATGDDDDDGLEVVWVLPEPGQIFQDIQPVLMRGEITAPPFAPTELTGRFSSDLAGQLLVGAPNALGEFTHTATSLAPGWHELSLEGCTPLTECAVLTRTIGVCEVTKSTTFDADLSNWTLYGDASWDAGGFIELTGNIQDRAGQVFNTIERINPGDVAISFEIQTGPNTGTGADGFALSIIDATDATDLAAVLAGAAPGGGLAYGFAPPYGTFTRDALHVEIDTWQNIDNGTTELHTDPTDENHIAVTLDGDPTNHIEWSPIPNIEDGQWHEVLLEVQAARVIVTLDGVVALDSEITGWSFRGGYIGFSGSTGYYTNNHRIQNLELLPECVVPEAGR